ncbi:SAM-dependent methyltransferase, BioC-like [hydrothermal vent metagenome]|uniref:SAM-dependent methyltransferase, BioC-like n=1 Tax=hydrothermal vent metagenome TaxID=652676 RepID=A0A3B0SB89_9ZZZZ
MTNTDQKNNPAVVFDRTALRKNRDRVAGDFSQHDFLVREVADRLYDKYRDINRDFQHILDLGCHGGEMAARLKDKFVIAQDLSDGFLHRGDGMRVQADEEFLPYRPASLDLVVSNLSLHWVNDLPGCLAQIMQVLKPDGLFLGAMLGGESLTELRQSMMEAEINIRGGASPRISPFLDMRDGGALLQRAGFALPVAEVDRITVTYENAFKLMQELRAMGEANILSKRMRGLTTPRVMMECARIYQEKFTDHRGRIKATFDIIYLMGWSPHKSQQQPLKPGQGKVSLTDVFGGKG